MNRIIAAAIVIESKTFFARRNYYQKYNLSIQKISWVWHWSRIDEANLKLVKSKGYKKASLANKRTIMRCVCIIRQDSKLLIKL